MKVFAHRGASGDYPENTILAFDKALALDVYGIELDVHKSKDGHLVVIHDEDIQRTFKGKGLVMDYTLSELKKFNCRKFEFIENLNCKIPTLREVFELIKNTDIILNIEAKTCLLYTSYLLFYILYLLFPNKYIHNNMQIHLLVYLFLL